jgi:uncharacterized membrane protein (UPF0127 family)
MPLPRRLRRLPCVEVDGLDGCEIRLARDALARLLGLAGLRPLPPATGLLLPRTRSVHTAGMRHALDLVWLDRDGRVVRVDRAVPPWRVRGCRAARAVVEFPSCPDPYCSAD